MRTVDTSVVADNLPGIAARLASYPSATVSCVVCSRGFAPERRRQNTCTDACKLQRKKAIQRAWTAHRATKHEAKSCGVCGRDFVPRASHQKACGAACSKELTKRTVDAWKSTKRQTSPEWFRVRQMAVTLAKYNLSEEGYQALFAAQDGKCAICGTTEPGRRGSPRLAIDHDHATGKVRGLLCHRCNAALGLLDDDPPRLRAAVAYLARGTS